MRFNRPLPKGIYANDFTLPSLGLAKPDEVLDVAVSQIRLSSINKTLSRTETPLLTISADQMAEAESVFHSLVVNHSGTIEVHDVEAVLVAMGLLLDRSDLDGIVDQLLKKDAHYLSFADITEIAAFMQQMQSGRPMQQTVTFAEGAFDDGSLVGGDAGDNFWGDHK